MRLRRARAEEDGGVTAREQVEADAIGGDLDRLRILLPEVARDDRQDRFVADRSHPPIAMPAGSLAVELGGLGVGVAELMPVVAADLDGAGLAVDPERRAGEWTERRECQRSHRRELRVGHVGDRELQTDPWLAREHREPELVVDALRIPARDEELGADRADGLDRHAHDGRQSRGGFDGSGSNEGL